MAEERGHIGRERARRVLVIGAAGSGKSAYAEKACVRLAEQQGARLCYLATMPSEGDDAQRRIERHRGLRAGKGFETLELPHLLAGASPDSIERARGAVVLLECLGTLAANELFGAADAPCGGCATQRGDELLRRVLGEGAWRAFERSRARFGASLAGAFDRIMRGAALWMDAAEGAVIVTNDVFGDGGAYDEGTEGYRAVLGAANRVLAIGCDAVVEVVCGIPVSVKGGLA